MTVDNAKLLTEVSGAEVEWMPEQSGVKLQGSAEQIKQAARLIAKVELHCQWGAKEDKIKRILKKRPCQSLLPRLSPVSLNNIQPVEKRFGAGQSTRLSIGKDKKCDVIVEDTAVSRQHCELSFHADKGAVYVQDHSTNGTFLNGKLLSKKMGQSI